MERIRTQEDFIKKATEIHDGYYDYSLVKYVRSNEKVKIICPIHGIFEQTPNKHLKGQGCKQCGKDRTRVGFDGFVQRAIKVHGIYYDYSQVEYHRWDEKVCIVCPKHGPFWQTPNCHITLGQGCPKCAMEERETRRTDGGMFRPRNDTEQAVRTRMFARRKSIATCMARYGAKTYAESAEGRARLHEIGSRSETIAKWQGTCLERYGAKTWSESEAGHEKLHLLVSSETMRERVRQGYVDAYGVDHYMKTETGKATVRAAMLLPEHRLAIRQAFMERYGVPNALASSEVQAKIRAKVFDRYGVSSAMSLPYFQAKAWATKRRNGTFNSSKPEETMYLSLCDVFGKENVFRQYVDKIRYPFHCDFYIPPFDLFIELNASWTHGGHWFDESNPFDLEALRNWIEKSSMRGSRYYHSAIQTWTKRDPMKLQYALKNRLNYVVFWESDLSDFRLWLNSFVPGL